MRATNSFVNGLGTAKKGPRIDTPLNCSFPRYLFKPMLKDKPLTFATINTLATQFQTSLAATAIRLVQFTNRHAVLICSSQEGRTWFEPSKSVTAHQNWPRRTVSPKSAAYTLLHRDEEPAGPKSVSASVWFGGKGGCSCCCYGGYHSGYLAARS